MRTFIHTIISTDSHPMLQLTNDTTNTLRSVEILTVFLTDPVAAGNPSRTHIRFAPVAVVRPHEMFVVPHKTWIDGKAGTIADDELDRLETLQGSLKPYVLDISWQDAQGKTNFQRIPVGH